MNINIIFILIALLINQIKCSGNIVYVNKMAVEYSLNILKGDSPTYQPFRFYLNFYNDYNCKDLRYGGSTDYLAGYCMQMDICQMFVSMQNHDNWYGNSVAMVFTSNGKVWCSNSLRYGMKLSDNLPAPFDLQFTPSTIPTTGGLVTMTGNYLRSVPLNTRVLSYSTLGKNYTIKIPNETKETFKSKQFKATEYIFKVGSGAGTLGLNYYHSFKKLAYSSPSIKSVTYSGIKEIIDIIGENFYERSDLIEIYINGSKVSNNSSVISVTNHRLIKFKYPLSNSGTYNFMIKVSGSSSKTSTLKLTPIINNIILSNNTNINNSSNSIRNSSIIINGLYLSGQNNLAPSPIFFGNDQCILISYNSTFIKCSLLNNNSINNSTSVRVYISINGIKNTDSSNNIFIMNKPNNNQTITK